MTMYLISFPGSAMDVPAAEMPAVAEAANAVVDEARAAGVLVCAGGIDESIEPVLVDQDGTVATGTYPVTREFDGGLTLVEVASRKDALGWAAKIAAACRCPQEVRVLV